MTRIISVEFHGTNQSYAYYTDDDSIEVGSTCVVDSPFSGLTCVKVVSIKETVETVEKVAKWIVQRVDTTEYDARKAKEEKRAVILAKIKKAKERIMAEAELSTLVSLDPSLAGLIDELKGL